MHAWDPDVRYGDIRRLRFASGSVDAVYCSHALEHLYLRDAQLVLAESKRVMRSGAVIRIALPDATELARRLLEGERRGDPDAGMRFNESLLAHPDEAPSGVRGLVGRAGGHIHRWQPTPGMVLAMLTAAGFTETERRDFRIGSLPDLAQIELRSEGFFLEARS